MTNNIKALVTALKNVGIYTEVWESAEWYCTDNKVHIGIEVHTGYDTGEDCLSFYFSPDGKLLATCLDAPLRDEPPKKRKKKQH